MADPDEDALSWAGEDDPSLVTTTADAKAEKPKVAATAAAATVTQVVIDPPAKPATSSLLLVTYGLLAGVYLLYTVGWVITIRRGDPGAGISDAFAKLMFQLTEGLAIASPALWFAAAILLTVRRKPIVRLLWLLIGTLVVIPWPFLLGV